MSSFTMLDRFTWFIEAYVDNVDTEENLKASIREELTTAYILRFGNGSDSDGFWSEFRDSLQVWGYELKVADPAFLHFMALEINAAEREWIETRRSWSGGILRLEDDEE